MNSSIFFKSKLLFHLNAVEIPALADVIVKMQIAQLGIEFRNFYPAVYINRLISQFLRPFLGFSYDKRTKLTVPVFGKNNNTSERDISL